MHHFPSKNTSDSPVRKGLTHFSLFSKRQKPSAILSICVGNEKRAIKQIITDKYANGEMANVCLMHEGEQKFIILTHRNIYNLETRLNRAHVLHEPFPLFFFFISCLYSKRLSHTLWNCIYIAETDLNAREPIISSLGIHDLLSNVRRKMFIHQTRVFCTRFSCSNEVRVDIYRYRTFLSLRQREIPNFEYKHRMFTIQLEIFDHRTVQQCFFFVKVQNREDRVPLS